MINLTAVIDNDEAKKKFEELGRVAKQTTSSIVTDAERMDAAMRFRPQIDKRAAQEVEKTMRAIAETMPLNIGAAFQKTEKQIKSFVTKLQKEAQLAQISAMIPKTTNANPLAGMNETLALIPEKAEKAAGSMGSLNFATQQLVREVPAATMGLHMFFLAISNNLPYFADAIKQVREENKALASQGKPTTSAFKQITNSILSWQTALVGGITALTLFGKEIGNWLSGLFKSKEAFDATKTAQEGLNKAISKGSFGLQDEIRTYEKLRREWVSIGSDLEEQKRFINEYRGTFDDLGIAINDVREAESLFVDHTDEFLKAMRLRAEATAAETLAVKQYEMALIAEREAAEGQKLVDAMPDKIVSSRTPIYTRTRQGVKTTGYRTNMVTNAEKKDAQEAVNAAKERAAAARAVAEAYYDIRDAKQEEARTTLEDAGIEEMTEGMLKEEEDARRKVEESKRTIQQLNKELANEVEQTRMRTEDAEIKTIQDAIERKQKEILTVFERRSAEIDKLEQDIRAEQGGNITDVQEESLSYLRQVNTDTLMAGKVLLKAMRDEAAQEATDAMNEYLASYGTFQERLVAITAKYSRLIAEAQTEGERKSLEAERDAILAEYEVQASDWAKSLVDKSTKQLQTMASNLQSVVDSLEVEYNALDSSDTDEAKQLRETINMLKAQIKELRKQLNTANKAVKDGNWAEATQVFQNISKAANDAAEGIAEFDEGAASVLRTMAQLAGTAINLVGAIQAVTTASAAAAGTISVMEKASAILAVIGAVIQAVSALIVLFKGSDEVEKTRREFEALNTELERLHKLARIDSVTGTIFGENAFGNFTNNLSLLQDFNNDLLDIQERIRKRGMEITGFFGAGGLDELVPDKADLTKVQYEWQSFYESIANMQVQTRHSTWFRSAKYQSLESLYPELFEGGELSLDGLKKLQESELYSKLSAENRELIDELIANWDAYNDTLEATNEYMRDVFGDVGESIGDALTAAFEKGTEAAKEMSDAISDIVENLVKDMAYAALLQPIMDDAMTAVGELNDRRGKGEVGDEEYTNELIGIVGGIIDDAKGVKDQWSALLEAAQDAGEDAGLSLFDGESDGQSATSKGFAAMSQETGDELNGRFTDIQGKVSGIYEGLQFLKQLDAESLKKTESISQTVAMIHNDTMLIEKHTRVLADMNYKLEQIRKNTEGL